MDEKLVRTLEGIYRKSESAVGIGPDLGEWFKTDVGVKKGDPLSPLLFIAYLDRVMDSVKGCEDQDQGGVNIGGTRIKDLRFADDIDLLEENDRALQKRLQLVGERGEQSGLFMNLKKTKTMVFESETIGKPIKLNGQEIQNVQEFEYLGSLFTWNNDHSQDIKRRIGKATGSFTRLKQLGALITQQLVQKSEY